MKLFIAKIDSVFSVPNTVNYGTYGHKIHEVRKWNWREWDNHAHETNLFSI